MKPEEWNQLQTVYEAGLDLPTAERPAYWQRQFQDNPSLRAELDLMIRGDQQASAAGFLDQPAWQFVAAATTAGGTGKETEMVGKTLGTYEILRPIGKGGMGEVYLAKDQKLTREVALKVVTDVLNRDAIARFQDEMRSLCHIEHDNVARLYDSGTDDEGHPFIVMEYLREFTTLRDVLRDAGGGGLPLDQVREITRQGCIGLAQAHDKGIVHRDVKPENIMLVRNHDGLRVKVIDFGIAVPPVYTTDELRRDFLTHRPSGISPGTYTYKSPEQMVERFREDIKNTSDVYAFGLVVYEMLTGNRYFFSIEHRLYDKHPAPASALRPQLGPRIDAVIRRALSPQPQQRQPDIRTLANEVIAALPDSAAPAIQPDSHSSTEPTEYVTPSTFTRVGPPPIPPRPAPVPDTQPMPKPPNRWLVPGVSAAAILLLAAVGWGVWSAQPAKVPASNVTPAPAVSAPVKTSPQMTLSTFRNNVAVAGDAAWRNRDVVKFKLSFSQDGLVYALHHGSDGALSVLYPHQNANGGKHNVTANQALELPPQGSSSSGGWRLDEKSGTETFYLIFAPTDAAEDELLKPINAAVQAVGNRPAYATLDAAQLKQLQTRAEAADSTGVLVRAVRLKHTP